MEETRDKTEATRNTREAEGFFFYTEKDAALAVEERKRIDYLEKKMDYNKPEMILKVYDKIINDRLFETPVGLLYLQRMRKNLLEQPEIDPAQVRSIPLYMPFHPEKVEHSPIKPRIQPSKQKPKQAQALPISIILNIALVIAVILMFVIALRTDEPNILNYERALTDRYAGWEQELTQREQAVRDKELELELESE